MHLNIESVVRLFWEASVRKHPPGSIRQEASTAENHSNWNKPMHSKMG
jgi:hypothetical protein